MARNDYYYTQDLLTPKFKMLEVKRNDKFVVKNINFPYFGFQYKKLG